MATLNKYSDGSGYYVKNSFSTKGKLFHVTYQLSTEGLKLLLAKDVGDGNIIPKGLFQELLNSKDIYTNKSGVEGEITSSDFNSDDNADSFLNFTQEAQIWVLGVLESHPKVQTRVSESFDGKSRTIEMKIDRDVSNFHQQLMYIAKNMDGTDFFKNLDQSYNSKRKS